MQVFILCNGVDDRWGEQKKQLLEIDGEKILHRTVRQVYERIALSPTIVSHDPTLRVPGADFVVPSEDSVRLNPHPPGLSTVHLWGDDDIILLLGDVRYSDAAMDTILQPWSDWTFFCRFGPTGRDGHPIGGEGWAIYCPRVAHTQYYLVLHMLDLLGIPGQHFWQQYRMYNNKHTEIHRVYGNHVIIDDETEDFDFPSDLEAWLTKHRR